ncbi:MAG: SDR family oxidoreductase [Planctomycetes bacterium]|nr:SDR family oxidoreductase [Planctomycetota bacterium]
MNFLFLLFQAGPTRQALVSEATILLLTIVVIGLLVVVGLLAGTLARWRKRQRPAPPRALPTSRRPSAWEEAGRRAATPSAQQLGDAAPDDGSAAAALVAAAGTLSGKRPIALVTGGARRVGRAIALALAKSGCDVVFTYNSSEDDARQLLGDLRKLGAECFAHRVDLLDLNAVDLFAAFLIEGIPRLDILVHNASVYTPTPLHDFAPEEAEQQFRINALAPLLLTSRLIPMLRESTLSGGGSVVAMVDIHAMGRPRRDFSAYAMSKAALAEMVHSLARDLAPHVRVNGVAPGVVAWPETGHESDEASQVKYLRRVPLERQGTPEDAAEAVRWLALDAKYTTGEIIRVDGGRWIT